MNKPSNYELAAWNKVQIFQGRPINRAFHDAGEKLSEELSEVSDRADAFLEDHPQVERVVSRTKELASKGAGKVIAGADRLKDAIPEGVTEWLTHAMKSTTKTFAKISRAGLSAKGVLELHKKAGHGVSKFGDVRTLDLEQIDEIGKRGTGWYYPAIGAAGGVGAGLAMTGGELVVVAGAGATAGPGAGVIAAAYSADAALVFGLAARSVAHVGLLYGYDPDEPTEKLFAMSIINAGTAATAAAKTAAYRDVAKLTKALVRSKTWEVLNQSAVSQVATKFTQAFGDRLTKQGLGKMVPAVGMLLGGVFNWSTLEAVFDRADHEYRRRFLLEKYPYLGNALETEAVTPELESGDDIEISVLEELRDVGGPDLTS